MNLKATTRSLTGEPTTETGKANILPLMWAIAMAIIAVLILLATLL